MYSMIKALFPVVFVKLLSCKRALHDRQNTFASLQKYFVWQTMDLLHITMTLCNITMTRCNITMTRCNVTMTLCNVTMTLCNVTMTLCNITITNFPTGFYSCMVAKEFCMTAFLLLLTCKDDLLENNGRCKLAITVTSVPGD